MTTHGLEGFEVHVTVHVAVVDVAQVQTVLLEQREQVEVVPDQVLGYLSVRLTQVEGVHIEVSTHAEVLANHRLLLMAMSSKIMMLESPTWLGVRISSLLENVW